MYFFVVKAARLFIIIQIPNCVFLFKNDMSASRGIYICLHNVYKSTEKAANTGKKPLFIYLESL